MSRPKYDVYAAQCPTRQALDRIADKWTALIVGLLGQRTHRFGELRRGIDGISHKVLSQILKSLERDGLVLRVEGETVPPTVEYSLTRLGRTLVEPLAAIRQWAEQHIEEVEEARAAYSLVSPPPHSDGRADDPRSRAVQRYPSPRKATLSASATLKRQGSGA